MSLPLPTTLKKTGFYHSTAVAEVIRQLREIALDMARGGFEEEAITMRTTIGDLHWQYEELIEKELGGLWPNGPRRPMRELSQVG